MSRVAIVGAGLAGLACAGTLDQAGWHVEVFDKGRAPGGRIASRRFADAVFDHGAQFATARGDDFRAALAGWQAEGVAAIWPAASTGRQPRFVGVPTMAALPAHLAVRLTQPPQQLRHVGALHRAGGQWQVRHHPAADMVPGAVSSEGGELAGPFDMVVVALPGPQATLLLQATGHEFATAAAAAAYAPCWSVMATFATPLDLADVQSTEDGPVAWLAREASRPGRAALPERLVIHASASWSRERLERPAPEIRDALLGLAVPATPATAIAHRWRFAKVEQALGQPCLWDRHAGLGACGDWCLGGRVEAAWDSGRALARLMLDR